MMRSQKWLLVTALFSLVISRPALAQDTAKSPDGLYTVSIVPAGEGDENGTGSQAIDLYDANRTTKRRLLISKWNGVHSQNLVGLSHPIFSLDGGFVYFSSSDVEPTSGYVHRIDLKLNTVKSICSGSVLRVMRTGPYRGYLLVQTHRYWDRPEGGSYNPVFLTHPSGKKIMMVPGSDNDDGELAVDPWLAKMNWRAW